MSGILYDVIMMSSDIGDGKFSDVETNHVRDAVPRGVQNGQ